MDLTPSEMPSLLKLNREPNASIVAQHPTWYTALIVMEEIRFVPDVRKKIKCAESVVQKNYCLILGVSKNKKDQTHSQDKEQNTFT